MSSELNGINFRQESKNETGDYQKKLLSEIYQKMAEEGFKGNIVLDECCLNWELPNGIILKIDLNLPMNEGYIAVFYSDGKKEISLTHWHPSIDEIYKDLFSINDGNVFWVVKKKTLFKALPVMIDKYRWEKFSVKKRTKFKIL